MTMKTNETIEIEFITPWAAHGKRVYNSFIFIFGYLFAV